MAGVTANADDGAGASDGLAVRGRAVAARVGERLRSSPVVVRWLVLGTLVGASAGLVVVAFVRAISFADGALLHRLAGYAAPTVYASGDHRGSRHVGRPWVLPLLVGVGGGLAGLVALVAPEVAGSGTDEALEAVHDNPRRLRLRSIPAKILASACTIGSGGSGGPEGPSAQVAAAVGSWLTRLLDLPPTDGRVAVAIGLGSGIGCVFRAPLGGALLSAEILYRQDAELELVVPSAIASIIAYTVFAGFQGFGPLMGFPAEAYTFRHPLNLVWFVVVGLVAAGLGLLYAAALGLVRRLGAVLGSTRRAAVVRPAVGGLLAGAVAVAVPGVLGAGDGWAQRALGASVLALPLWFVLAMPVAKVVATVATVGSGGSGGLFSPGMVIGAFVGAGCWRLLRVVSPGLAHDPAPFVIVGMMCCLGSVARVPLAVTVMVAEMTTSIGVVAPALLGVGVASLVVGHFDVTLIDGQLRSRDDTPARRLVSGLPLLEGVEVAVVMAPPRLVLDGTTAVATAAGQLAAAGLPGAPVVDERGRFVGVVDTAALGTATVDGEQPVGRIADRQAAVARPELRASVAAAALATAGRDWLPVLDDRRRVVGVLTAAELVRGYRGVLWSSLRRITALGNGTAAVDGVVGEHSPLAGRSLADAELPPGTVVLAVTRGPELLAPSGETVLAAGDGVSVLVPRDERAAIDRLLAGEEPAS
jgi:H+/Cl- antiporter ClcA